MSAKKILWKNIDHIELIRHSLGNGKVVVGSSDTVFGLLANTTLAGFNNLNAIKNRTEKPYIILIDKIDKLKHFVLEMPDKAVLHLLQTCWPGALTALFKANPNLPDFLQSSDHKIALRIPQHAGLLTLAANFEGLFSTSANLAGQPVPSTVSQISPQIINKIDLVVADSYTAVNMGLPSTILDCSTPQLQVVRAGAYDVKQLEQIYGGVINQV
jgi:L-threonylcarbamoyladenylate synthase